MSWETESLIRRSVYQLMQILNIEGNNPILIEKRKITAQTLIGGLMKIVEGKNA